jgi:DNA-binding NtrC family response regulator
MPQPPFHIIAAQEIDFHGISIASYGVKMLREEQCMAPVFVIDDHQDTHESIKLLFESEGYLTHCFPEFETALNELKRVNPCLILTDAKIPCPIPVTQFITQAKVLRPDTKLVLYSGDPTFMTCWQILGADGFVLKPGEPNDLIALVKDECKAA